MPTLCTLSILFTGFMHRFTVQHLLAVTFASCVLFAACNAMGMSGALAFGVLVLIATPAVAFIAACIANDCSLHQRVVIGGTITLLSFAAATIVAIFSSYRVLAPLALFWLVILWLIQWAALGIVFLVWRSGIESVRRAEQELEKSTKPRDRH